MIAKEGSPIHEKHAIAEFCSTIELAEERGKELEVEGTVLFFKKLEELSPVLLYSPVEVWFGHDVDWPKFPDSCLLEQKLLQIGKGMTQVQILLFNVDCGGEEFTTTGIITINPEGVSLKKIILSLKNYHDGQDLSRAWVQVEVEKPTRFKVGKGAEVDEEPEPKEINKLHLIQISCLIAEKYVEGMEKVRLSR